MPWFDKEKGRRPWRDASAQDVFDAVHAARQYHVQQLSQLASIVLALGRIESRLASIEARISPPDAAPSSPPHGPVQRWGTSNVRNLDEARAARDEWRDVDA